MATEQEMDYVDHQLNALFDQSQYNQNGWAVIRYSQDTNSEQEPIYRSQLAANQDSINYWANMNIVFETELNDIAIAHIFELPHLVQVQYLIHTHGFLKMKKHIHLFIMGEPRKNYYMI